mmetsp:Transcript_118248/g.339241  ORF Transcript_118248/g.339241 Transcript_118248/m.339241 type:complete len:102 (-) Transcript_118248:8-313(-)
MTRVCKLMCAFGELLLEQAPQAAVSSSEGFIFPHASACPAAQFCVPPSRRTGGSSALLFAAGALRRECATAAVAQAPHRHCGPNVRRLLRKRSGAIGEFRR